MASLPSASGLLEAGLQQRLDMDPGSLLFARMTAFFLDSPFDLGRSGD